MDTKEAAKELGISTRSLQRAVGKNKISVAYQRGQSGKMEAIYDSVDVARYKAELTELIKPEGAQSQALTLSPTARDMNVSQEVVALLRTVFE